MTAGAWLIAKTANVPFLPNSSAIHAPWWWTYVAAQEQHIQYIQEVGAYDAEKMVAPKELWPLNRRDDLNEWHKDREKLTKKAEE